jgi:hypothetical protein
MAQALKHLRHSLRMVRRLTARDRVWVSTNLGKSEVDVVAAAELLRRLPPLKQGHALPSVFLSHSHRDKPFVRSLAKHLEQFRLRVWLDEAELNVGDSLVQKLSEVIKKIDLVLAVLSKTSVKSRWVQEELQWAMSHQIARRRIKVLPLLKEECQLPAFLEGKLYADFTTPYKRKRNLTPLVQSIYAYAGRSVDALPPTEV